MSWIATERFEARAAPAGLALVQELINTHTVGRGAEADLLADRGSAQEWLSGAARQWASASGGAAEVPDPTLSDADLAALRGLRALVAGLLAVPPGERAAGAPRPAAGLTGRARVVLVSDAEGRVGMVPSGAGLGWLESAVWSEILLAQQSGAWVRLKLCREARCRSAFYDTSRNGSGVWHNVRTCGNIANLRASRDRKKQRSAADGVPGRGGEPAGPREPHRPHEPLEPHELHEPHEPHEPPERANQRTRKSVREGRVSPRGTSGTSPVRRLRRR